MRGGSLISLLLVCFCATLLNAAAQPLAKGMRNAESELRLAEHRRKQAEARGAAEAEEEELRTGAFAGCGDVLDVRADNVEALLAAHGQLLVFFVEPALRRCAVIRPQYCAAAARLLAEPRPLRLGVADMALAPNAPLLKLFARDGMPFMPSARLLGGGGDGNDGNGGGSGAAAPAAPVAPVAVEFFQGAITSDAIVTWVRRHRHAHRVATVRTWGDVRQLFSITPSVAIGAFAPGGEASASFHALAEEPDFNHIMFAAAADREAGLRMLGFEPDGAAEASGRAQALLMLNFHPVRESKFVIEMREELLADRAKVRTFIFKSGGEKLYDFRLLARKGHAFPVVRDEVLYQDERHGSIHHFVTEMPADRAAEDDVHWLLMDTAMRHRFRARTVLTHPLRVDTARVWQVDPSADLPCSVWVNLSATPARVYKRPRARTAATVSAWAGSYFAGAAPRFIKSEPEPAAANALDAGGLTAVVATTFHEKVVENEKDVLLLLHGGDVVGDGGHVSERELASQNVLRAVLALVAADVRKRNITCVEIASMDGRRNEVDHPQVGRGFDAWAHALPTLLLFPAKDKLWERGQYQLSSFTNNPDYVTEKLREVGSHFDALSEHWPRPPDFIDAAQIERLRELAAKERIAGAAPETDEAELARVAAHKKAIADSMAKAKAAHEASEALRARQAPPTDEGIEGRTADGEVPPAAAAGDDDGSIDFDEL